MFRQQKYYTPKTLGVQIHFGALAQRGDGTFYVIESLQSFSLLMIDSATVIPFTQKRFS